MTRWWVWGHAGRLRGGAAGLAALRVLRAAATAARRAISFPSRLLFALPVRAAPSSARSRGPFPDARSDPPSQQAAAPPHSLHLFAHACAQHSPPKPFRLLAAGRALWSVAGNPLSPLG
eukprot:358669-Chlamydomonas_euryale.AAC.3